MNVFTLYLLFAKIGLFTFGGGYAMIPLFQDELVVRHAFISPEEFANMVALAQITPGPVGLNAATYIGYRQMGLAGALAGTLGVATPSLILVTLAAVFFLAFRRNRRIQDILYGIRPATLGLIAAAVIFFAESSVFTSELKGLWSNSVPSPGISWPAVLVFLAALAVNAGRKKAGPVLTLLGAAILGGILNLFL
ncbi:MAG: chromate transporter [Lentisphaeria bacterium]|nr:chromate transporter [Lentisphaeria bacterium]